jgi:hypothetical protein
MIAAPHQFETKPAGWVMGSTRHPARVWIPSQDKTVFFRQIGGVVAQIEVEDLVGEGYARLPIETGG